MSPITQQMQRYDASDEARFLQQQADDAKVAMQQTLGQMRQTARAAADVRWWTQRYPWYAMGSAGLVGFIAATRLGASSRRQERSSEATPAARSSRPSVFSSIFSALLNLGRSMLMSTLIGAISATKQEPTADSSSRDSVPYQE